MEWDVAIVGAGVVGLACAERLACAGRSVLVIERHRSFGRETSSRSSEVVHAGIYPKTGTLKARLCVAGNRSLAEHCARRSVPFARIGKHVVATSEDEEAALETLRARGAENGVEGLSMVARREIEASEPNVIASAALRVPSSAIVDSHALMASLLAGAQSRCCDVAWSHQIDGAAREGGAYVLRARDREGRPARVRARGVVNAAGLSADEVAASIGIDVDAAGYRLAYAKGSYCRLRAPGLVRGLVYPIPPADLGSLGIHTTVDLGGAVRLGPDLDILPDRRLDYRVSEDAADRFFTAASRYLRGIRREDVTPDRAGIRPKLARAGGAFADFVVAEESARGLPGWVNLVGIESPGLTCAIELARLVEDML